MFWRRKIDGIIFDLGNVLLPTEPNKEKSARYWAQFSKLSETEILNIFCHGGILQNGDPRVAEFWRLVNDFDRGDIVSYDMHLLVKDLLRLDIGFYDFVRGWEMIVEPDADFINFLYELQHLRLGIISNLCEIHVRHVRKMLPRRLFCSCLYSCVEGVSKPDRTIFLRAIKGMGLLPGRILFVDDIKINVEAAESAGMRGYHYDIHSGLNQKQRLEKFKQYLKSLKAIR